MFGPSVGMISPYSSVCGILAGLIGVQASWMMPNLLSFKASPSTKPRPRTDISRRNRRRHLVVLVRQPIFFAILQADSEPKRPRIVAPLVLLIFGGSIKINKLGRDLLHVSEQEGRLYFRPCLLRYLPPQFQPYLGHQEPFWSTC